MSAPPAAPGTDPDTIAFYQTRAPHYVQKFGQRHSFRLDPFLDRLPPGARVLELGCGGGQDAARIAARGFVVDATDATPAVVAKTNERFGLGARVMAFDELDAEAAYAGIWAHASLLHAPRAALPGILARIHRAAVPGAWHFASYKLAESEGADEGRDSLGRFYNFPDAAWLMAQYTAIGWDIVEAERDSGAGFDNVIREWINLTVRKP